MKELKIKRVYLPPDHADGYRILVDRMWPRGLSKEKAHIDEWAKEITPAPVLRKWFGHKPENFEEFKRQYLAELDNNTLARDFVNHCHELLNSENVTLLYGARSETCNHAVVLKEWIMK